MILDLTVQLKIALQFRITVTLMMVLSIQNQSHGQYSNYDFLLASKVLSIESKVYKSDSSFSKLKLVDKGGGYHSEKVIFNNLGDATEIYRYKDGRYEILKSFSFSQGHLIESRKYRGGILHSKEITEYDSNDRLKNYSKEVKGELWESNTYEYYSDGFKTFCSKPKFNLHHEIISYTDENGNVIRTVDNELFLAEEVIYEYDRQSRLLSKVGRGQGEYYKYLANGDYVIDSYLNDVLQSSMRFNVNNQRVKSQYMDDSGDLKSSFVSEYDSNGYPISLSYESTKNPFSKSITTYILDSQDNVIEIRYYSDKTNEWFVVERLLQY